MSKKLKILLLSIIIILSGSILYITVNAHISDHKSSDAISANWLSAQVYATISGLSVVQSAMCQQYDIFCSDTTATHVSVNPLNSSFVPSGLVGFATLNGGVSGGSSSNTCHVKDVASFAKCAEATGSATIVFDVPTLTFSATDRPVFVNSNKTLEGPVTIEAPGNILEIVGQQNIIIKDISFKNLYGQIMDHPLKSIDTPELCPNPDDPSLSNDDLVNGCGNPIIIEGSNSHISINHTSPDNSHNIWIQQNTFSECGNKCVVVENGNETDSSGRYYGATNISISNNLFENSLYGVLISLSDSAGDARQNILSSEQLCEANISKLPNEDVSVYDNFFNNVRRRSARAVYCTNELHEFNNVIENWGEPGSCSLASFGFGPSGVDGAQLLLQNNYLSANPVNGSCKAAVNVTESWYGIVKENGDTFINGAYGMQHNSSGVFTPPYTYTLIPSSKVFQIITQNAGAK